MSSATGQRTSLILLFVDRYSRIQVGAVTRGWRVEERRRGHDGPSGYLSVCGFCDDEDEDEEQRCLQREHGRTIGAGCTRWYP